MTLTRNCVATVPVLIWFQSFSQSEEEHGVFIGYCYGISWNDHAYRSGDVLTVGYRQNISKNGFLSVEI